jgi:hypothetical protein
VPPDFEVLRDELFNVVMTQVDQLGKAPRRKERKLESGLANA